MIDSLRLYELCSEILDCQRRIMIEGIAPEGELRDMLRVCYDKLESIAQELLSGTPKGEAVLNFSVPGGPENIINMVIKLEVVDPDIKPEFRPKQ